MKEYNSIDKYKLVSIVDSAHAFSFNDCVYLNQAKNQISYLNVSSQISLKLDELVSSYEQVIKMGHAMAYNFANRKNSNKLLMNMVDQFDTSNNFGFNLANFRP